MLKIIIIVEKEYTLIYYRGETDMHYEYIFASIRNGMLYVCLVLLYPICNMLTVM
jgi:hypothetical protein